MFSAGVIVDQGKDADAAKELRISLTLTNTGPAQRFGFRVETPLYQRQLGKGLTVMEGSPLYLPSPPLVTGMTQYKLGRLITALPACSPTKNAFHGFEMRNMAFDFDMPAGGIATAEYRFKVESRPSAGIKLAPRIVLSRNLLDGTTGTLKSDIELNVPQYKFHGKQRAWISMKASPGLNKPVGVGSQRLRQDSTLSFRGKVAGARRGSKVILRALGGSPSKRRTVAIARTGEAGRFAARWKLRRRGVFEIWASYPRQPGKLAAGYACPLGVTVR